MQAVTLLILLDGDVCWAVHRRHLGRDDPPVDNWTAARIGQHWDWSCGFTPTASQFTLQYLIEPRSRPVISRIRSRACWAAWREGQRARNVRCADFGVRPAHQPGSLVTTRTGLAPARDGELPIRS